MKNILKKISVVGLSALLVLSPIMGTTKLAFAKEDTKTKLSETERIEINIKGKKVIEEKEVTQEDLVNKLHDQELNILYLLDTSGSREQLIKKTYQKTDEWLAGLKKSDIIRYSWDYDSYLQEEDSGKLKRVGFDFLQRFDGHVEATIKKDASINKIADAMEKVKVNGKYNFLVFESDMQDQFISENIQQYGDWKTEKRAELIKTIDKAIKTIHEKTGVNVIIMLDNANKIFSGNLPYILKDSKEEVIGVVIDSLEDRDQALNKAFTSTIKTKIKEKVEKTVYPNYTFKSENINGEDLENQIKISFNDKEFGSYDDKSTLEEIEFAPKEDGKLILEINSKAKELKEKEQIFKVSVFEDGKLKESKEIKFRAKVVMPGTMIEDIATKTTKEEVEIPFKTERKENSELAKGEERVVVKGENGKKVVTTVKEGSREAKVTEEIIKEPVNEVIEVGTMTPNNPSTGDLSIFISIFAMISLGTVLYLVSKSKNKYNISKTK